MGEKIATKDAPRMFPIQSSYDRYYTQTHPHPRQIPWSVAELAYSVYSSRYGDSQSLEQLAERQGFGPEEMDDFLPDWRERCNEIAALREQLASKDALISRLQGQILDLNHELKGWRRYKANIDEALNMGDGSYRP